jgi:transposase-like protein
MVVCPSCGSTRIRNDYRPAPVMLRVIFIRALLCDYCNLPFRAFSPSPPRHGRKPQPVANTIIKEVQIERPPLKIQKKSDLNGLGTTAEDDGSIPESDAAIIPIQSDLRTEIARVQEARNAKEAQEANLPKEPQKAIATCPECGSSWVRRRQRSGLERAVFALTNHKAFICRSCDASFYARVGSEEGEANGASNIMGSSRSAQT